jgi:hypothetical protein
LLKAFKDECRGECDNCPHFKKDDGEYKCRLIADFPPVTPKEKTGEWKIYRVVDFGDFKGIEKYKCSECGEKVGVFKSNFCPNCGAKMVEPQESEG